MLAPRLEQRPGQRLRIGLRFGRHVVAGERLDRCLVGANAIDIGGDPQLVHQPLEIEILSAWPGDCHRAHRVEPDFRRVGRQLVAVVGISGGVCKHRLARGAHPADRFAEVANRGLAAAEETVEIERNRFHPIVAACLIERRDQVAKPIFAHSGSA